MLRNALRKAAVGVIKRIFRQKIMPLTLLLVARKNIQDVATQSAATKWTHM
jgi:hypothetical protein